MRIITWNCYRGECWRRAEELLPLSPDICVLQECGRPERGEERECVWFGTNPRQGVGVIARNGFEVMRGPVDERVGHSVFPVRVHGPQEFNLLAVWALPRPTYVRAVSDGLSSYAEFIHSAPTVVLGDFNSHARWDSKNRDLSHTLLVQRLREEFGLISAYHHHAGAAAVEEPTLYWQRKQEQPFHIDYCFVPLAWLPRVKSVSVGNYTDWQDHSDHRPLTIEVEPNRS